MPDEHVNAQSTHIQKWSFCRDLLPRGLEIDVSHTHTHTHSQSLTTRMKQSTNIRTSLLIKQLSKSIS